MRRRVALVALCAANIGLLTLPENALAQPAGRQIRLVVPFPAGGPTDIVARPFAKMLGDALKSVVVIDNRGGAGGSLGADAVAKSAPDGRTLLMATVGTHAINPALYKKLPYDAVRDFTPIALVALAPVAIVVHPSQPVKTVADLVALAKRRPEAELRLRGRRNARSSYRGNVQDRRRYRHPARSLPGQRAGGDRSDRRSNPDHVRSAAVGVVERARQANCAPSLSAARRVRPVLPTCLRSRSPATTDLRPPRGGAFLRRPSCLPTWHAALAGEIERIVRSDAFRGRLEPWACSRLFSAAAVSLNFSAASSKNGARPCATPAQRLTESMKLNDEEEDILAGKSGPVARQALQHQIKVGEFFGAEDFVPVTQAHIMADTESLGEAGVRWLEGLAASPDGQRRVRIPTITDPRGTDFSRPRSWVRPPRCSTWNGAPLPRSRAWA